MGTQFWWFFDAAAAVIVLIAVFIAGKRGFSKSIVVSVGCILGIIFSASISGGVAGEQSTKLLPSQATSRILSTLLRISA